MSNRVRTILIVVVTVVWGINMLAPIVVKDYTPASELNVAFMAVLGVLTASYRKKDDDNDDDESQTPTSRPA